MVHADEFSYLAPEDYAFLIFKSGDRWYYQQGEQQIPVGAEIHHTGPARPVISASQQSGRLTMVVQAP